MTDDDDTCECGGTGVFGPSPAPLCSNTSYDHAPPGVTFIEKCDLCGRYADDWEATLGYAAEAWPGQPVVFGFAVSDYIVDGWRSDDTWAGGLARDDGMGNLLPVGDPNHGADIGGDYWCAPVPPAQPAYIADEAWVLAVLELTDRVTLDRACFSVSLWTETMRSTPLPPERLAHLTRLWCGIAGIPVPGAAA
jgi:hypothetical protein